MKKEEVILNLEQVLEHSEVDGFLTISRYLQQSPSNTLQYLYKAVDDSLLEVDIYATVDGQLRKAVSFDSFEQSKGFPMEVTLADLENAIERSKHQTPLRYRGTCATKWEEIKFLVGGI